MKIAIAMGLFALSMVALGGCSSMESKSTVARSVEVDDGDYVARVENMAVHRGVSVHWVNPPTKRIVTSN